MAKGRKSKKKEEVFHVAAKEVLTAARVALEPGDKHIGWEYLVKWANYPDSENSWEPESNLAKGCERLLDSFWGHVGFDNKDYPLGHVVRPKKAWIEKEKAFFQSEFDKVLQAEKDKERAKSKGKGKGKETEEDEDDSSSEEEEDEKEKEKTTKNPKKTRRKASREVSESSARNSRERMSSKGKSLAEISSGDDDVPLQVSMQNLKRKAARHQVVVSSDEEPLRSTKFQKTGTSTKAKGITRRPSPSSPSSLFSDHSPEVVVSAKVQQKGPSVPSVKPTRRPINPQAKIANMSPSEIPMSSGGISTKNRIGHGALVATLPKNVTPSTQHQNAPHPLPNRSASSNFMNLSFKKNSLPTPVAGLRSPMVNDPTLASLNSPTAESPQLLTNSFSGIARQNTVSNVEEEHSMDQSWQPFAQNDTVSLQLISPPPLSEAESFLQSIMHPILAGPLLPAPERPTEPMPPKAINPTKLPLPIPRRIPKVWRWSGPLFRNSDEQAICNVQIHDLSGEQPLKFSMIFEKIDKIQVDHLYNNTEYYSNLGAFRTPPQLASFSPEGEKDEQHFSDFAKYLTIFKKVFLMPIKFDNNTIGHVLFFPYVHRFQVIGMDVPPKYNFEGSLVAAIVPYALSPEQLVKKPLLPQILSPPTDNTPAKLKEASGLHAQQILGFSDYLFKYMKEYSVTDRSYCIWSDKSQGKKVDVETQLLASILKSTKAPHVPYASEARIIFVHIAALATLHNLPRFAERRTTLNYVQFYVYGSHPDVSPALRSVQEIYPCGGIVTFSPFAMRADPLGVMNLIRKIYAHPLWMAYILPSALGLLAKLECGAIDPMKQVDEALMMDAILEAIAAGQVALIQAPPDKPKVTQDNDAINEWLAKYLTLAPPSKRDALAAGIKDFLSHPDLAKAELAKSKSIMNEEILSDLNRMQKQPSCMAGFRRYVVIDSDCDRPNYIQGVEWTSLAKFDFKDDFYPKHTR